MRRTHVALAAVMAVLAVDCMLAVPSTPANAAADTIDGYVYRDANNNGVFDAGETPVAGVVLRSGSNSAITDAGGHYVLTGITKSVTIRADAGWFRTQCTASYSGPSGGSSYTALCPDPGAGAGPDQDFGVSNQLLTATAGPGGQASLGLTPDWAGDGYGTYSTDLADANVFDPALRLSPGYPMPGADADCQNFVCRPGETQWVLAQWMNQGTHTLRRFRAVITAPQGSVITQVRPYTGYGPGTGNAARGFRVVDVATKTALRLIIPDWFLTSPSAKVRIGVRPQVLPGTEFLLAIGYRMNDDAPFSDGNNDGVPDCSADTGQANPGQTCERATDFAPGSYIAWGAVVSIRNAVDADATFCPQIPNNCPALGVHDKTKPGDSNDAGAWKVDSSFPPG